MLAQRLGLLVVGGLALSSVACASRAGEARQPMGHVEVRHLESPDDAPEQAKTVQVAYVFDRDPVNKDFDKTFKDGFDKKGVRVDEELTAHAHFGVSKAKITGTVTYVKKGFGHYSILDADLVAEAHYDADVQLDLDVKVKGDTKKAGKEDLVDGTALGGKPFTLVKNVMPTNIPIAGPLFLHAHFDLTAACDLAVEGQMHATTGVGVKGDVRLTAKYKKAGFEQANGKKSRFAFEAKTPNFELAPRPYLKVEGKQQHLKGKCSLQPTAVLLLEHSVGAKLMVEPWIELDASRPSSSAPWKLDAQAGVSVNAATDIELFGRQMRKPKEFTLFEIALTKKGDAMGTSPKLLAPAARPGSQVGAEDLRVASTQPVLDPFANANANANANASDATATAEPAASEETKPVVNTDVGLPVYRGIPDATAPTAPSASTLAADAKKPEAGTETSESTAAVAVAEPPPPSRKNARGKKTRGATKKGAVAANAANAAPITSAPSATTAPEATTPPGSEGLLGAALAPKTAPTSPTPTKTARKKPPVLVATAPKTGRRKM